MKSKYLLFGLAFLAACSQEQVVEPQEDSQQEENLQGDQYLLKINPFRMETGGQTSRTVPTITDKSTSYQWVAGDSIGIFPFEKAADSQLYTQKGDQVGFTVTPKEDANKATFDGGGWQIKKDLNYIAYYPFIDKFRMDPTKMEVSFAGQAVHGKDDYSNFGKYDFMVAAPKQQATVDGGMSFEFDHVAALCVLRFNTHYEIDGNPGTLQSIDLEFPTGENLFWETATMDLTKGLNALTAKKMTNKISIDLTGYAYTAKDRENVVIPFMQGAAKLKDKNCQVKLTYNHSSGKQKVLNSSFTFNCDLECGHGYFLNVGFPEIDPSTNTINQIKAGILNMQHVRQAMNGTNRLVCYGQYNAKDMMVIREAAGYKDPSAASTNAEAAASNTLEVLDMSSCTMEGEGNDYETVKSNFFANTKLTTLKLTMGTRRIEAKAFENVPLTTLDMKGKFAMGPREGHHYDNKFLVIDPEAFTGLNTEACDLAISDWMTEGLSTDETGQLFFINKKFKSIKVYIIQNKYPSTNLYQFVTADAETHTVHSKILGALIKADDVTKALNGGTALKVTGVLKDKDLKTIATAVGATLTSLTFENIGEYVPTDNAFTGFTNSANCDLFIPDAWKSMVSAGADGKVMFGGVAWKSVKSVDTGLGFTDLPDYEPGLNF